MEKHFFTLIDAINDLKGRGFNLDFNLKETYLDCPTIGRHLSPQDFEITETHHFDGQTDVDDEVILYAIESNDGLKGILVQAYGTYADPISADLVAKLKFHK